MAWAVIGLDYGSNNSGVQIALPPDYTEILKDGSEGLWGLPSLRVRSSLWYHPVTGKVFMAQDDLLFDHGTREFIDLDMDARYREGGG